MFLYAYELVFGLKITFAKSLCSYYV